MTEVHESQKNSTGVSLDDLKEFSFNNKKIRLWLKSGKDVWNKNVSELEKYRSEYKFENIIFDFSAGNTFDHEDYAGYIFPSRTIIANLITADFSGAIFKNDVLLSNNMSGTYSFSNAKFHKNLAISTSNKIGGLDFSGAEFQGKVNFSNCKLEGIGIEDSKFKNDIPDFRYSIVDKDVYLLNVEIPEKGEISNDTVLKYRKLKEFAINSHDHEQELKFSACEMKALRKLKRSKVWHRYLYSPRLLLDSLYDHCSNYGRSIIKPVFYFVLVLFLGFFANYCLIKLNACLNSSELSHDYAKIIFTVKNSIPILPITSHENMEIRTCLFGQNTSPPLIKLIGGLQFIVSTIFLFLIGLGLRNRFKIK